AIGGDDAAGRRRGAVDDGEDGSALVAATTPKPGHESLGILRARRAATKALYPNRNEGHSDTCPRHRRTPPTTKDPSRAGGVAAKTLREGGYDGRRVLIGHEPTPPFGRPPLSKTYLRGEESLSGWLVNQDRWYESNRVELVAATATGVNVPMRQVELDAGR